MKFTLEETADGWKVKYSDPLTDARDWERTFPDLGAALEAIRVQMPTVI